MPYIQTRTNCGIDKEREIRIKERLGEAIRILNKSEDWLMVEFVPDCKMYFQGRDDELIAYVDVKIYGRCDNEHANNMTDAITDILEQELGIKRNCIYVSYGEFDKWGWNGRNF